MALGRPREFDTDRALDQALDLFWRHGYEGSSLTDLTQAMGITRPSLYAAFGNKEGLFRKALDRYIERRSSMGRGALEEPTSRRAVERLLMGFVGLSVEDTSSPRGCLMVQAALACSAASENIRQELAARRAEGEAHVRRRLEEFKQAGDLPEDADPAELARYVMTVGHGIAVQAAGGASAADLTSIVEMTMRSWPSPPEKKPAA